MGYRLEDLGAHEFEHMVQALLVKIYGPTVEVFGPGPDGGRDGTYEGRAIPQDITEADGVAWDGHHVFQVKFRELLRTSRADQTWLHGQIRSELRRWVPRFKDRKAQKPEYIVFVTNVPLSGQPGGALEKTQALIREIAAENDWPLKGCAVWERSKVERILAGHADVRQQFNGLITVGDVLASMDHMTRLGSTVSSIRPLLEEHARWALRARGQVSLGEAGQIANERLDLSRVAMDLPALDPHDESGLHRADLRVIGHILAAGESVLRPSVCAHEQPHFLLIGGPGQGKTTVGRLLVQIYRSSMLDAAETLSQPVRDVVGATLARLGQIGVRRPKQRRWPVRVDLAEYADQAGGGADISLLRFIAESISRSMDANFHARDMRSWLAAWPWLLVLDGFDEVVAPAARQHVASALHALLEVAHTADADLLVVATTRPQGYSDELPPSLKKLELAHLSTEEALAYATLLTELRMGDDAEKPAALERIAAAAESDVTRRLMRTPLQVMIMSLLLERQSKPPQDRAALFTAYYDVIYDREVQKKNHLAKVLSEHRPEVDAIHYIVGLKLQMLSEEVGDAEALLSNEEFTGIVRARLLKQEFSEPELGIVTERLIQASKERLVLITPKGRDEVGFELRSLQEFMASRALVSDREDPQVIESLRLVARSAHWRNTWLLGVGAVYGNRHYLFARVLHMLREIDADDPLSLIVETGPRLALEILEDGMAAKSPKDLRLLVDHALESLKGPSLGAARLGGALADVGGGDTIRPRVITAVKQALAGDAGSRHSANLVLQRLSEASESGPLAAQGRQLLISSPSTDPASDPTQGASVRLVDAFPISTSSLPPGTPAAKFYRALRAIKTTSDQSGVYEIPEGLYPPESTSEVLCEPQSLGWIAEAIDAIDPANWPARSAIVSLLWRARERLPVDADVFLVDRVG